MLVAEHLMVLSVQGLSVAVMMFGLTGMFGLSATGSDVVAVLAGGIGARGGMYEQVCRCKESTSSKRMVQSTTTMQSWPTWPGLFSHQAKRNW